MTLKQMFQEIYEIGFEHGSIETKNKILKTLNRDSSFFYENGLKSNSILDRIDKIKLPKPKKHIWPTT